jgi:predicted HAD superfamily Cof-like phosphohydrolase
MASNFEKVIDFNEKFGIPVHNTPQPQMLQEDTALIQYRMNLIREEMKELEEAVETNDFKEVVDALSDILYVVYGMGATIGVNLDKAYSLVHDANMSKLCKTEEEAQQTVEWYKENDDRYDSPNYRLSEDGKYYVVYNQSTKKILKSINWKEQDFTEVLNPNKVSAESNDC